MSATAARVDAEAAGTGGVDAEAASAVGIDAVATTVFANTDALLLLVDEELCLLAVNAAAAEALDLDTARVAGRDATIFVAPRHAPDFRHGLREALGGTSSVQEHLLSPVATATSAGTAAAMASGAHQRSIAWTMSRVREAPCLVACVGIDVTASRDEREDLRVRATTDQLTGLPNRAGLMEHLAAMGGSGATVVFCDLNGFKTVNDSLGHAAGDAVLVQTARRLKRTVRGEDFVARLGGDEFVIVVPPDSDASFDGLARRLLRAIEQPMVLPGPVAATVGMSVGRAVLDPGQDPVSVLVAADEDMYKMKSRLSTRTTADAI